MANFDAGLNLIRFEENVVKSFHGSLTDLKYDRATRIKARLSLLETRMLSC